MSFTAPEMTALPLDGIVIAPPHSKGATRKLPLMRASTALNRNCCNQQRTGGPPFWDGSSRVPPYPKVPVAGTNNRPVSTVGTDRPRGAFPSRSGGSPLHFMDT